MVPFIFVVSNENNKNKGSAKTKPNTQAGLSRKIAAAHTRRAAMPAAPHDRHQTTHARIKTGNRTPGQLSLPSYLWRHSCVNPTDSALCTYVLITGTCAASRYPLRCAAMEIARRPTMCVIDLQFKHFLTDETLRASLEEGPARCSFKIFIDARHLNFNYIKTN